MLNRVSRLLWGPALEPERYELVTWIFLRLLGGIYVAAFASLAVQIQGLVGHAGILPLDDYLDAAHQVLGRTAYRVLPTLFWLNSGDTALIAGTVAGVLLGLLVILDRWTRPALIALFALYLSYVYAGQDFMRFQWDLLLLETGFLAIFLASGSRIAVWLYRWLVFRYFLLAGAVKLLSGDPTWHNLTALEYHFWTQPLPTPLAWYAAQLPPWFLVAGTAATLGVELGSVVLIFLPRRPRAAAAWCLLVFQALILFTGNYNFFNLLSMAVCILLFDDAALRGLIPQRLESWVRRRTPKPERAATVVAMVVALVVVPVGLNRIWEVFTHTELPVAGIISQAVSPLLIVNPYGLFAVMTPLPWNIPHQPRLDWQMWFAALGDARANPWFQNLMLRLLEGSPPVLALLDSNPFPDRPPKYVEAKLYDYRFAERSTHAATGQWWVRQLEGIYFPQVSLADFGRAADSEVAPSPSANVSGR
ncbi:MAG: lipase maturation factor family protein [Betaproteobacteria bacterium]|nr:MAG: lipase maturation factor family protein [Betaproteobacteria bacterium]